MDFDTSSGVRMNSLTRTVLLRIFLAAMFLCVATVLRFGVPAAAQTDLYDCSDFNTQPEAQAVFNEDPSDPYGLDEDSPSPDDGIACETLPGGTVSQPRVPAPPRDDEDSRRVVSPPKTGGIPFEDLGKYQQSP